MWGAYMVDFREDSSLMPLSNSQLLRLNPRRRYGIDEILEHRYFLRNEYVAPLSHSQRYTLTMDSSLAAPPNSDTSKKVQ
jgi:hypothetical protein